MRWLYKHNSYVHTLRRQKNTSKLLKCPSAVNCWIWLKPAAVDSRGKPRQLTAEVMLWEQNRHRGFQNSIVTFLVLLGAIFSHFKSFQANFNHKNKQVFWILLQCCYVVELFFLFIKFRLYWFYWFYDMLDLCLDFIVLTICCTIVKIVRIVRFRFLWIVVELLELFRFRWRFWW